MILKNDEQLNVSVSNHFMQWGDLLNVKVLKDWMDRPYAFVQYERMSDAKKALREAPGTVLDGRNIRCEPARVNRTLCLAPLDNTWLSEKKIQGKLTRFGEIEDITLTKSNSQAQCAFVKFRYRDDAIKAFLSLRASQASSHWCVEWASNLESSLPDPAVCRTDKLSVFIGNLPETVTESAIYSRFGHYGNIVHLRMHRKTDTRAGKRVFAFVRYTNKQEAAKAIEHENGAVWVGRPIRVAYREYHEPLSSLPSHSPYMERPHPPGMGFPASIYQYQMATGNKEDESKATETGCYFQPPIISQQVGSTSREPLSIYYDTTAYMPFTSMTDMAYPYNKYQDCPVYPYYPMPVYSPPHDQFSAYYDNPYYTSMYYVYPPLVPSPPPPPITSTTWRPKLSDNHHRKMGKLKE
ncbi:hypothetical protein EC973_009360 [Apophysomyces ossiformis]|uniref:RRM domain-containing protein n=1 Tax=Apophysomyces ossiformis TaxID=679940 RepID=A0A8H7BVG1_9FUNG|nr:hypothetical protein EC973_009360 [Apophysomyces ossiformis]